MTRLFDSRAEREVIRIAAMYPRPPDLRAGDVADVRAAARAHGVEAPFFHGSERAADPRAVALALQHDALRAEITRLADALGSAKLSAILLKGFGLAERFYDPPWSRPCTDVDLLVAPNDLAAGERALASLGYETESGARGRFFRERHFHLHLHAPGRLPVELHFFAYRGFGRALDAGDLFAGAIPCAALPSPLLVPAPARELVYLAVHAAAHRFQRIGWLFDVALFLRAHGDDVLADARIFATRTGFARSFEAAMMLVHDRLGAPIDGGTGDAATIAAARRPRAAAKMGLFLAPEPGSRVLRSFSRFLYTLTLCDDGRARARYAARAMVDKVVHPGA